MSVPSEALNCPSCGGAVPIANRFVKMVVCPYCGNTLDVRNHKLDPTGQKATLVDYPTRFRIGQTGQIAGQRFHILGRVRFEDEDGFWDEWYLEWADGGIAWLEEEEGQYTLSRPEALTDAVLAYDQVRVGSRISVNGDPMFVTERCEARIAGAEGQLYFRVHVGRPVRFVDGNLQGRLAALEYTDDRIEFTLGESLPRQQVLLDGET